MADFQLADGRAITFDFSRLTVRQWRALFDPKQKLDEEDALIAGACGLSVDEYLDIPLPEWRKLVAAFFEAGKRPISEEPDSKN